MIYRIEDYYHRGFKASSFQIKDGKNHQNSESYYATGEQFRSALYFYYSLMIEYYFYKNGDSILDFSKIDAEKVYHVTLPNPQTNGTIEFDTIDGKIILESYEELTNELQIDIAFPC